jgi:hypothetical protein
VFLAVIARTVALTADRPTYNWDMLCYMALALSWEVDDPVEIHRRTYDAAREQVDRRNFRKLAHGGIPPGIRTARYEDPAAFYEHIAFYRSRIFYTLPIYIAHKAGAPLTAATWWLSLAAFALTALLVLLWTAGHLPLWLAVPTSLGLMHAPPLAELAGHSTPDALYLLFTCAGIYALVERRSLPIAAVLLTASIGVRPDGVILVGFLAPLLWLAESPQTRPSLRFAALWIVGTIALYLALDAFGGGYGWWPLFTIYLEPRLHPSELSTQIDVALYWEVLRTQVAATRDSYLFPYLALALVGLFLWRRHFSTPRAARCAAVLIALLGTFVVRYLLFPELWVRFIAPYFALVPLLLLSMASGGLRGDPGSGAATGSHPGPSPDTAPAG